MNAPFIETQRFDQWWLRLLFAGINGLFACAVLRQLGQEEPMDALSMPNGVLIAAWLSVGVFTLLFIRTQLITRVDGTGVHVRFAPWQRTGRYIPWTQLQACRVRRYRPLIDFGGWGLRRTSGGRIEAYTVRGDHALELDLGDHKRLLIGTARPEQLAELLRLWGRLRPSDGSTAP